MGQNTAQLPTDSSKLQHFAVELQVLKQVPNLTKSLIHSNHMASNGKLPGSSWNALGFGSNGVFGRPGVVPIPEGFLPVLSRSHKGCT